MKMRNRFIVTFLCLLGIIAFSSLTMAAPDPQGNQDSAFIDCTGPDIFSGGTAVVKFDLKVKTDNTGLNRLASLGAPLLVTVSNSALVYVDTNSCMDTAFVLPDTLACGPPWSPSFFDNPFLKTSTRTTLGNWNLPNVGVGDPPNDDPTISPFQLVLGGANFTGGLNPGTYILAHIVITVDDTCTICFDTLSTTTLKPSFITEGATGYDFGWTAGGFCCQVTPYINKNPDVECGIDRETFAGGTFNHFVTATDPDDPNDICDSLVSSKFVFLDSLFVDMGLGDNNPPCGIASLSGPMSQQTFNWNTTGCTQAATYYVVFTYTDECGGSGADTCKYVIKTACAFVKIGEVTANPGEAVDLPVTIQNFEPIGGFSFCIEWANADLTGISVSRGAAIAAKDSTGKYIWHYFTYRLNPSTVIHKYKVCVVGIGKLYSSYPGMCLDPMSPTEPPKVLFTIKFVLADNELFRCHDTHVNFEWDSWTCTENTLSDCTGNKLFVSDNPNQFPPDCINPDKQEVIRCVNFGNGRVIWRCGHDLDPCVIGDINVNGFAYDLGDAVLFAGYFISGLDACDYFPFCEVQRCATDINQDGYTLSLADLVYLLRIVVGDQAPLGAAVAPVTAAEVNFGNRIVSVNSNEALGAMVFTFKGEGKVVPMNDKVEFRYNAANGETRVLVTLTKTSPITTGNLFSISGKTEIVKVEAATYGAQPITVNVTGTTLPKNYSLSQNYPNPFNATTQISFALPKDGNVSLKIYNVAGQLVKTFDEYMTAGYKTITWDGINKSGDVVASGVYFYRLDTEGYSKTMKMTLLK